MVQTGVHEAQARDRIVSAREAHIPTPEPPHAPRPIDDPKPSVDPPVRDPQPDELPNPPRYGARGAIMSSGRTHASYCDSLT